MLQTCLSFPIEAPRTVDYEECTVSGNMNAGMIMIYLTLLHSLEVLFPSCYAVSTLSDLNTFWRRWHQCCMTSALCGDSFVFSYDISIVWR